ncbi:MAG: EAL domain-containing protein [Pseudomonadota bacterium]
MTDPPASNDSAQASRYKQALNVGEVLFRQGETGTCAYVIETGSVQISNLWDGQEQVIAVLQAGDIVGEMALIDDLPRSATAVALTAAQLRVVTREYLADRIHHSDPLLRHVLRRVIQRLRTSLFPGALPGGQPAEERIREIEHDEDRRQAMDRLHMAQDIQQALDRNEFELHLQPIVRLVRAVPIGFEALIRWKHPRIGYIPPTDFIALAEESDLILDIGRWTFDTACTLLQRLDEVAYPGTPDPLFVAVNLSGHQFTDPQLFNVIERSLAQHRIDPRRLKLEVTETTLIHNFDVAVSVLERFRVLGFKLALDDFGTGYSSLSYLNRFPVDTLKIDRAFVKEVVKDPFTQKIVRAVAGLGRDLGMTVLAEGVETEADASMLISLGVEFGQGYLYGKAMPVEQAQAYLRRHMPLESPRQSA